MIRRIDSMQMIKQCAVNQLAVATRFNVVKQIYALLILLSSVSAAYVTQIETFSSSALTLTTAGFWKGS